MRRVPALLFTIIVLAAATAGAGAQRWPPPEIHARRDVQILNAGLLIMNDTFTLEAPGGLRAQITGFDVGFQDPYASERRSFYISSGGGWQPVEYREVDLGAPGFHGYRIELPSPVTLGDGQTLRIRASYLFVDRVSWDRGDYSARIPVYPAIPYNLSSFVLQVELPEGAELRGVDSSRPFTNATKNGVWTLTHQAEMLTPLRNETAAITYEPAPEDEYLLDCELLQRGISVKPSGLKLEDTYVVTNMGATIRQLHIRLPEDASSIKAHDRVGPLTVAYDTAEKNGGRIDLYVAPRSPIRTGERWSFTVAYSIPREARVEGGGGRFTLTYPAHGINQYIRRCVVVATLPIGGRFVASRPEASHVERASALTQKVTIVLRGVIPSEQPEVIIDYGWSVLWSALWPTVRVLIAAGALASIYILRRRRAVEERPAEAAPPVLEEFLNAYVERVALLAELEGLERGLERKEVGREHFDRRSAEIARRQRELLQALRKLEGRIEVAEPRMRDRLLEIKEAEAELDEANTDLRNLEVRLRARRISRRDYERRRRDYIRRRRRARRRIEQLIAALQAEA